MDEPTRRLPPRSWHTTSTPPLRHSGESPMPSSPGSPPADAPRPGDDDRRGTDRRLLIVDSDPFARSAVCAAIAAARVLTVVGLAASADAALAACASLELDVVVIAPARGEDDAQRLVAALCARPRPPLVLVFSALLGEDAMVRCLRAGASGYIRKAAGTDALVASLRALMHGEVALSRTDALRIVRVLRCGTAAHRRHR